MDRRKMGCEGAARLTLIEATFDNRGAWKAERSIGCHSQYRPICRIQDRVFQCAKEILAE